MIKMTQETHQQVKVLRRLIYLMALFLVLVFVLAITGLVLASPETVSTNPPTSSPGTDSFTFKSQSLRIVL